jgi:hypothetical protein
MVLKRHLLILALASCNAWLAPAIAAPAEVADMIHATQPYGQAPYRFLTITAYTAQLWTDASHWNMNVPFALTLTYGMHFSTDGMVSRTREELKHVDPALSDDVLSAYVAKLDKAFPPVAPDDRITALSLPGGHARFYYNGTLTATIDDPDLNRDFFSIWLSPRSSDPELEAKLVGGH